MDRKRRRDEDEEDEEAPPARRARTMKEFGAIRIHDYRSRKANFHEKIYTFVINLQNSEAQSRYTFETFNNSFIHLW